MFLTESATEDKENDANLVNTNKALKRQLEEANNKIEEMSKAMKNITELL